MSTTFELSGTRPRILVVDDNLSFTRTAQRLLQLTGRYLVREETDPRRVLETALGFQPDLILLDLIMPELDGAEVAAELAADWMLHRVPIVFVSGLITPEEARDGRRIEGHRLIAKPISGSELIKVVEENLPTLAAA